MWGLFSPRKYFFFNIIKNDRLIAPRIAAYIMNATSKFDSCVRERCITLKGDLFFFEQVEEGEGGTRKQEDDELDQLSVKSVGT